MNRAFSIYLDLVRFVAACLVYISHSNLRLLSMEPLPASAYGISSVTVFFVLSGFVIAYVTDNKENDWKSYTASRVSRIFSVALPAIFLTIVLDATGRQLYPNLYGEYPFDNFIVRGISSLLLLNEVWFVSILSFSNVPFWSICYESWYYVGFALVIFLPKRAAYAAVTILVLIIGPKILLLAPVWVFGVVLYRWSVLKSLSLSIAWIMVIGSVIGIFVFHYCGVRSTAAEYVKFVIGDEWKRQLVWSKYFLADYILGCLVFINFAGMRVVSISLSPLLFSIERPVRSLAGYTLSLYLLHQPLLLFWGAVIRGNPAGYLYWWMTTGMVVLSVAAIGYVTENKRHLLKRWLEHRLASLGQFISNKCHALKY